MMKNDQLLNIMRSLEIILGEKTINQISLKNEERKVLLLRKKIRKVLKNNKKNY